MNLHLELAETFSGEKIYIFFEEGEFNRPVCIMSHHEYCEFLERLHVKAPTTFELEAKTDV